MAGIVDLYRIHAALLAPYFASEEQAAEVERRAALGDDRAMRLLSLAYDSKLPGTVNVKYHGHQIGSYARSPDFIRAQPHFSSLHEGQRNAWHEKACEAGNLHAHRFPEAVDLGLRCPLINEPQWYPVLECIDNNLLRCYYPIKPFTREGKTAYLWGDRGYGVVQTLVQPGTLRFELSLVERTLVYEELKSSLSVFHIVYVTDDKWPTDKRSVTELSDDASTKSDWHYSEKNIKALREVTFAGSPDAASLLSRIYAQSTFFEYLKKRHIFKPNEYAANPLYDLSTSKEWERIAELLEGKGTAIERGKFLDAFLYSQHETPAGLYNIGYALIHNAVIGDRERGLDYLKHAANLGDANAARELGEIHHDLFDAGTPGALPLASFWYGVAAELGHPNGKARRAYLEKAYPKALAIDIDETEVRNPSRAHIALFPASAWYVDVPISDISNILHDPRRGGIVERMEAAVDEIDRHVAEFENAVSIIQARIDDLAARQAALDRGVEDLTGAELAALRSNSAVDAEQRRHRRVIEKTRAAVRHQTTAMGARALLAAALGGGDVTGGGVLLFEAASAAGAGGAAKAEINYAQALIDELEAQRIDTSGLGEEIGKLALEVQRLADSGPINRLLKDEVRARALIEGYLRQRVLKSGLENCRGLEDYALQEGCTSIDELLDRFQTDDERLHRSLDRFCHGHASSNDMAVLLADANALRGDELEAHQRALKRYSERVIKGNIGHYLARASQIDVISDLGLISFEWMAAERSAAGRDLAPDDSGGAKLALATMFARQFGVTHIGQYDVMRMFSFYLTRHGRDELIAAELMDGRVTDVLAPKRVALRSAKELRAFVERAKESALRGRDDQPDVGDLFLRVCAYEYYLPQAVITSGRGNRFKENPEAPVAYPMVNRVVGSFIEKLGLQDLSEYRREVGPELDALLAQTFLDFFNAIGREHDGRFANDRAYLRDAHAHAHYGPRFDAYEDKIAADALARFDLFLRIYEANLAKMLLVSTTEEAEALQEQIGRLNVEAHHCLACAVPPFGSQSARDAARQGGHRGENMTERWQFSSPE